MPICNIFIFFSLQSAFLDMISFHLSLALIHMRAVYTNSRSVLPKAWWTLPIPAHLKLELPDALPCSMKYDQGVSKVLWTTFWQMFYELLCTFSHFFFLSALVTGNIFDSGYQLWSANKVSNTSELSPPLICNEQVTWVGNNL